MGTGTLRTRMLALYNWILCRAGDSKFENSNVAFGNLIDQSNDCNLNFRVQKSSKETDNFKIHI